MPITSFGYRNTSVSYKNFNQIITAGSLTNFRGLLAENNYLFGHGLSQLWRVKKNSVGELGVAELLIAGASNANTLAIGSNGRLCATQGLNGFYSDDNGNNWTAAGGVGAAQYAAIGNKKGTIITCLAGSANYYISNNNGVTYALNAYPAAAIGIGRLGYIQELDLFWSSANGGGTYLSQDGVTWTPYWATLGPVAIAYFNGKIFGVDTTSGLYYELTLNGTITQIFTYYLGYNPHIFSTPNGVYVTGLYNTTQFSPNGVIWEPCDLGVITFSDSVQIFGGTYFDDDTYIVTANNGVLKSLSS